MIGRPPLVRHERVPHGDLPHLPAGRFEAADPDLDPAERIWVGRLCLPFVNVVDDTIGRNNRHGKSRGNLVVGAVRALIRVPDAVLIDAVGLVMRAPGVVHAGRSIESAQRMADAGKSRSNAGWPGCRHTVSEVNIGSVCLNRTRRKSRGWVCVQRCGHIATGRKVGESGCGIKNTHIERDDVREDDVLAESRRV